MYLGQGRGQDRLIAPFASYRVPNSHPPPSSFKNAPVIPGLACAMVGYQHGLQDGGRRSGTMSIRTIASPSPIPVALQNGQDDQKVLKGNGP